MEQHIQLRGALEQNEHFFFQSMYVPPFRDSGVLEKQPLSERESHERALFADIDRGLNGEVGSGNLSILTGDRGCGKTTFIHKFLLTKPAAMKHWSDFESAETLNDGRDDLNSKDEIPLAITTLVNLFMTLFEPGHGLSGEDWINEFCKFAYFDLRRSGTSSNRFIDDTAGGGTRLEVLLENLESHLDPDNRTVRASIRVVRLREMLLKLTIPELIRLFYATLSMRIMREGFERDHYVILDNVDGLHGAQRADTVTTATKNSLRQAFDDLANTLRERAQEVLASKGLIHTILALRQNRLLPETDPSTTRGEGSTDHVVMIGRVFAFGHVARKRHDILVDVNAPKFYTQVLAAQTLIDNPIFNARMASLCNGNLRLLCSILDYVTLDKEETLSADVNSSDVPMIDYSVFGYIVRKEEIKLENSPLLFSQDDKATLCRSILTYLANRMSSEDLADIQSGRAIIGVPITELAHAMKKWDADLSVRTLASTLWALFRREAHFIWARAIRCRGFNGDTPEEFERQINDESSNSICLTSAGLSLLTDTYMNFEFWNAVNTHGASEYLGVSGMKALDEVATRLSGILFRELQHLHRKTGGTSAVPIMRASNTTANTLLVPQLEFFGMTPADSPTLRRTGKRYSYWTLLTGAILAHVLRTKPMMSDVDTQLWVAAVKQYLTPFLRNVSGLLGLLEGDGIDSAAVESLLESPSWRIEDLVSLSLAFPVPVIDATGVPSLPTAEKG